MACRNAYKTKNIIEGVEEAMASITEPFVGETVDRLFFGVDAKTQADDLLQNNIDQFEWIVRNKVYPNFYGRNMVGENCLTREEVEFIHRKGCKVAAIYSYSGEKITEEQGIMLAKEIDARALELGIPNGAAIFLEIGENDVVKCDFMRGFAKMLMVAGYTPAFKANTDAKYEFDHEFSTGMLFDNEVFKKCLIWAVSPTIKEYDGIATSHFIHPNKWKPFAPSGLTRAEIAIWQYGVNCHPIEDDDGKIVTFNLNLVRNEQVIHEKLF